MGVLVQGSRAEGSSTGAEAMWQARRATGWPGRVESPASLAGPCGSVGLGSSDARPGRLADHHEVRDVGGDLAADDPVDRAGLDGILVQHGVDLRGRGGSAVEEDALRLDDPLVLRGAGPEALAMPPLGA